MPDLLVSGDARAQTKPAAAPAPQPTAAQPTSPTPTETGRWSSRCTGEGRTGVLDCLVDSVVPIPGTPNLFLNVSLQVRPGKQRPMLRIVTPLAVQLEPGVSIKFDDGQSRRLPFEYCEQRGCIAGSELPPEMIDALKQGVRMTASFQTAAQQSFDLVIPTANFGKAYAKVE
jgi:invasion protein IalB